MTDKKRIGELLENSGYITSAQIEEALDVQSRPDEHRLLGQILVSRGYATMPQVQIALARQKDVGPEGYAPEEAPPRTD